MELTFKGFDQFKLINVQVKDQELGRGAYASVLELNYNGLKCAGKKIHELLLEHRDKTSVVRRFADECYLLSKIRHPNIVQFLGVYFQQETQIPILVMELLPTNLTFCIEKHSTLPNDITYSILYDVALGLHYLHSQSPPIIHRDLSSNNVLLTSNMTAKIADLGMARILNLNSELTCRMTAVPGIQIYMPPETMVAEPMYGKSIDEFSYGVLMIHVMCGVWPEPHYGPVRTESGKLIPVSEAERRKRYLELIGEDHPLMDLLLKCINNDPSQRARASEIVEKLAEMVQLHPPAQQYSLMNMLKQIRFLEDETSAMKDLARCKHEVILKSESKVYEKESKIRELKSIHKNNMRRMELAHSAEIEQLSQDNATLKSKQDILLVEKKMVDAKRSCLQLEISTLKEKVETMKDVIKATNLAIERQADLRQNALERLTDISTYLTTEQQVGCYNA